MVILFTKSHLGTLLNLLYARNMPNRVSSLVCPENMPRFILALKDLAEVEAAVLNNMSGSCTLFDITGNSKEPIRESALRSWPTPGSRRQV